MKPSAFLAVTMAAVCGLASAAETDDMGIRVFSKAKEGFTQVKLQRDGRP